MKQLLALLALALPLHAQQRQVDVSFFCLKYAPGLETIHIPKEAGSDPVRLSTANLTAPVKVLLNGDEASFLSSPKTADPKAAASPLAAHVKIPADIGKALIVLVPTAPGSATPYHAMLIDHGEKFRMGSYRVINFSRRSIRGAIGRSYIEAESGKTAELELKGEAGAVQGVRFEFQNEGRWNRLTETRCAVRKDRRWLLCVYQEPNGRMNMRSIPDRTNLLVPVNAADTELISASN